MFEEILCPACGDQMVQCDGVVDMPSSQEYWKCDRCGLNAHRSRLTSAESRQELRCDHLEALERRVEEGRTALKWLRATRQQAVRRDQPVALLVGLGLLLGAAVLCAKHAIKGSCSPELE